MLRDLSAPWVRLSAWWARAWPVVLALAPWSLVVYLLVRRLR